MKRFAIAGIIIASLIFAVSSEARFPRGSAPSGVAFNGKKIQTNLNAIQGGGDFPWLDAKLASQGWSWANGADAPVTPDYLDSNGYLKSASGNAASGIYTVFFLPSQLQRPGTYGIKCTGNGGVGTGSMNALALNYVITNITTSGTIQTVTLSTSPVEMKAGQPITLSNITGSGNWSALWNSWRVLDVNTGTNSFRIDSGLTITGTPDPFSGAQKAIFQNNSAVANTSIPSGLNDSIRYFIQPGALIGGADGVSAAFGISSIQSTSDYPHACSMFHRDDEAALDAGGTFTSKFLSMVSNFGVIRYLDWQRGNINNVTNWYSRKRVGYFSYGAYDMRPEIYAGGTTLSGSTYSTVSTPTIDSITGAAWNNTLSDKTTFHVNFLQSRRATSTFNGTIAFNGGAGAWEVTVNSGLSGFIAPGQTVTGAGIPNQVQVSAANGAGKWLLAQGGPGIPAIGPISMATSQNWNSPVAVFTNSVANISIPNHVYQVGDQVFFDDISGSNSAVFPSNITKGVNYFVVASSTGAAGTIQVSATAPGSPGTPITPNCTVACSATTISSSIVLFMNIPGTSTTLPIKSEYSIQATGGQTTINGGNNSYPFADSYRSLATIVYDKKLNAFLQFGGDISFGVAGIINGVPYETMLALGWSVGAHNWFVAPQMAVDDPTDFYPSLMTYDKNNRPSWSKTRFEGPNELWNSFGGFVQTAFASVKSQALWGASNYHEWYGKSASVIGQTARQIYGAGNLGVTYDVVSGVQTTTGASTGDANNSKPRFEAGSFISAAIAPPSVTGSFGTITYQAIPPVPYPGQSGATRLISCLGNAQYYTGNAYIATSGPQTRASLAATFGGIRFQATISAGTLTVQNGTPNPTVGQFLYGAGIPANITIGSGTGGTYTLSGTGASSITNSSTQSYTTGADMTAPNAMVASNVDTVVNATITGGTNFTVNSITSGNTVGANLQIYGGTVAFGSGIYINGGSYPNFTLNPAVANQSNVSFSVGEVYSLTGIAKVYQNWANWVQSNYGVNCGYGYEGGYSPDYGPSASANYMLGQSKQASALSGFTVTNLDNFRGLGALPYPGGYVASFPSNFLSTGPYPSVQAWAVQEDIYQSPPSPQWSAMIAY